MKKNQKPTKLPNPTCWNSQRVTKAQFVHCTVTYLTYPSRKSSEVTCLSLVSLSPANPQSTLGPLNLRVSDVSMSFQSKQLSQVQCLLHCSHTKLWPRVPECKGCSSHLCTCTRECALCMHKGIISFLMNSQKPCFFKIVFQRTVCTFDPLTPPTFAAQHGCVMEQLRARVHATWAKRFLRFRRLRGTSISICLLRTTRECNKSLGVPLHR